VNETNWGTGIYFLADSIRAAIIVINQLPETPETLWLRLLGKDSMQRQAIDELIALSRENPFRSRALELLASWRITIKATELIDVETQELIMQLSPAYTKWREETLQEGRQEGEASLVLRQLNRRIGELSPEAQSQIQSLSLTQLEALADALFDFSQPSDLQDWLRSQSVSERESHS
jgi:predicted transposase YdaD